MTNNAIMIKIVIIHVLNLAANFCWPSAPLSPQSGGKVGGLNTKPSGYASGGVNALSMMEGLTNLYLSITADPRMILSMILERNIAIMIRDMSTTRPKREDINSSFHHPSAF